MSGSGGKKRRGGHEEEHENHERWLVSYADMMTLLMVLFIVLFAVSQVDQKKFEQLRRGLAVGFGSESAAFQGSGEQLRDEKPNSQDPGEKIGQPQTVADEELDAAVKQADRARQSQMAQHAKAEADNLDSIKEKIAAELSRKGLSDSVRFTIDERGLVVTIVTSSIVFAGDRAELLTSGQQVLDAVGPTLVPLPNRIQVEGHTNQLPIATVNYPSGWELSSARASSVVRYLNARYALPENRMAAAGYADTRPLFPANDPRSTTMNRRVEVIVLSTLPAEERALLPSAAAGMN